MPDSSPSTPDRDLPSRRDARRAEQAEFQEFLRVPDDDGGRSGHSGRSGSRRRKRRFYRRPAFWVTLVVVIVVLGGAAAGLGVVLLKQATEAKGYLLQAASLAGQVEDGVAQSNTASAESAANQMAADTAKARSLTSGPLWKIAGWVPVFGNNFRAVSTASVVIDDVATKVVQPASKLNLGVFRPSGGRIDLQGVRGLTSTADRMAAELTSAKTTMDGVSRFGLLPQVSSGVDELSSEVAKAASLGTSLKNVVSLLPGVLGADGPKNYLMLFQNNAETRGWGGNPAALMLVHLDNGSLTVSVQSNSSDFSVPANPIVPLDPSMENLYGSKIGRYVQDVTTPADFPYTAQLATAMWIKRYGGTLDGVGSFDPVALSYLLQATGPIATPSGDTLTAQNAVPFLLNGVYIKYPDPDVQNAVFAGAASAVFSTVQAGNFNVKDFVTALTKAAQEHRLLFVDNDAAVQKVIDTTPMSGTMPTTNASNTGIGVFFDDTTGAKMDYYLHPKITLTRTQCDASGQTITGQVVLDNTAPADSATALPAYITGPYYRNGRIAMDVVIYGVPGGALSNLTVDGSPVKANYQGTNLGRPAAKVSVIVPPGSSLTIGFTTTGSSGAGAGAAGKAGPLQLYTTGLAQPTPTAIRSKATCG
jgi:hypothetical protein